MAKHLRLWLRSWIQRSNRGPRDPKKRKELVAFLIDFIFAIGFGVMPLPVVVKWIGWFGCWCAFLYIIQASIDQLNEFPTKTRVVAAISLTFCLIGLLKSTAVDDWRAEKAAAQEGDLIGAGLVFTDGIQRAFPMVQIGRGTTFVMLPGGVSDIFPFFKDSGVRIEFGKRGPLLTTVIRDRNGNLVAEVKNNHWRVYPLYCVDKNYTKDSLEIKDSAGHVVLQVKILPMTIRIQGEWWDTQGSGVRMLEMPDPKQGSQVVRMNHQFQHSEALIKPMFEYPSKDHWGELAEE